ncbi:hypothetical protein [Streptomyces sp. NPDC058644]|uniref:hypothetical protein n=1 Tax=unclassified Streptomyces TaxID=2593676 RepID=UPI00364E67C0
MGRGTPGSTAVSARVALSHGAAAVAGFAVGAVVVAAATAGSDSGDRTKASATITATETVTRSQKAESTSNPNTSAPEEEMTGDGIPGDGTFVVGKEVKAGTYRTAGPADDAIGDCYWARLKSTSGDVADIIANGSTKGPATVTISPGDKAFQTTGCKDWKKAE